MSETATVTIGEKQWAVDVAASPSELAAGLGGVGSIPAYTGMLFDLGIEQAVTVTTEPMLFSIDIIFISEDLAVVGVVENVVPGHLVAGETPVRYFLEVNAGETEGVVGGDDVEIAVASPSATPLQQWVPLVGGIAILGFVGGMVAGGSEQLND